MKCSCSRPHTSCTSFRQPVVFVLLMMFCATAPGSAGEPEVIQDIATSALPLKGSPGRDVVEAASKGQLQLVDIEAGSPDCGVKAGYVFLQLHKLDHSYDDVSSKIQVDGDGTSLENLQRGLGSMGCPTLALHATPENLKSIPLPAISHFESRGNWRHYMLLLSVGDDYVLLAEPTNRVILKWTLDQYNQLATGYYLVLDERSGSTTTSMLMFYCALAWLGFGAIVALLRNRGGKLSAAMSTMLGLLAVVNNGCAPQSPATMPRSNPGQNATVKETTSSREPELISVDNRRVTIGPIEAAEAVTHQFHLKNESSKTLSLNVSGRNCACIAAKLKDSELAPGATTECEVTLQVSENTGGTVTAQVTISAADTNQSINLTLTTVRTGLIPATDFVVRPAMLAKKELKPLQLKYYSTQEASKPRIKSVRAYFRDPSASKNVHPSETDKPNDGFATSEAFSASLDQITFNDPVALILTGLPARIATGGATLYESEVSVPLSLAGDVPPSSGYLEVVYETASQSERTCRVNLLVLSSL